VRASPRKIAVRRKKREREREREKEIVFGLSVSLLAFKASRRADED
jgi:hypothetical protein